MILLPDMTIEGHAVSLQAPYTINGYLITEIYEQCYVSLNENTQRQIIIGYINDENEMRRVCLNHSNFDVFIKTSQFLQENGPGYDENGIWVLKNGLPMDFREWFQNVVKQTEPFTEFCVSANPGSAPYIKLVKRLVKQCRAERYSNNPLYAEPVVAASPAETVNCPAEPVNSDPAPENDNETCLLPNVIVEGQILSLQAPYTINGNLITHVTDVFAPSHHNSSYFTGRLIDISYYDLDEGIFTTERVFARNIQETISPGFTDQFHGQIEGENSETDALMSEGYANWRLGVDEQHASFLGMELQTIPLSTPYLALVKKLIKQNRAEKYLQYEVYRNLRFTTLTSHTNSDVNNNRGFRSGASLEGEIDISGDVRQQLEEIANNLNEGEILASLSSELTTPRQETIVEALNQGLIKPNKKYIHPYDYKPDYIKHTDDPSSLLLGVEIEVGGNKKPNELANREKIVKRCIQIMNGSESDNEDLIYSTSDSSVQIELDTMPCSLTYHKKLNYKELFDFLDKEGYKGHDCEKAGLHVHANRDYLGDTEFQQQITITKIIYLLEKFNNEICVIARRDKNYSPFSGQSESNPIEKFNKYKQKGKNVALNLQHSETIEFRCFKSTLKYESFILILEFVQCIIDFAKSINIEEVESVTWNDLMRKFPTSVTEYYYERLKKIEKKLAKKKRKELNKLKKEWEKEKNPLHKKKIFKEMERVRKESLKVGIKDIVDIEEGSIAATYDGNPIFVFNGIPIYSGSITFSPAEVTCSYDNNNSYDRVYSDSCSVATNGVGSVSV